MNLWPWLLAGGIPAIALAAGLVLAPAATIGLLRAVARAVAGLARNAVDWSQANWWRAACVAAAITAASLAFSAHEAEQQHAANEVAFNAALIAIQQERDRVSAERDKAVADLAQHDMDAAAEYARITAELKAQQEANADAMADLRAQEARAAKSKAAWWRVYEGRSDQCKAAQEALDVACKGLGEL